MIYFPLSSWDDSAEFLINPSSGAIAEGMWLSKAIDAADNIMKVTNPAAAANTDIFAGLAVAQRRSDLTETIVEQITFPALAGGGATTVAASISAAPNNPLTDVVVTSADGTLTMTLPQGSAGAVVANNAGYFNATGNVITGFSGWAGITANVVYRRNISTDSYYRQFGDPYQGLLASDVTNTMGIILRGVAYTSYFFTGDNWEAWALANVLKVTTGGILSMASGAVGATVNGTLEQAPTVDVPFLGVRFSAT